MRTVITCPHSTRVEIIYDEGAELRPETWRRFVRETLLACPACYFEGSSYIEDVGK